MIRAVVFDLWGTLAHSPSGPPFRRFRESLAPEQVSAVREMAEEALTQPFPSPEAFVESWKDRARLPASDLERLVHIFWKAQEEAQYFPEAESVLEQTRSLARLALLSNSPSFGLDRIQIDLGRQFRHIFTSGELGARKPTQGIFEAVSKRLSLFPGDLAMVGDSWEDDVEGALAAGWTAIWINRARRPRPEHDPDAELLELPDLKALPDLIQQLQAGARCSTCLG